MYSTDLRRILDASITTLITAIVAFALIGGYFNLKYRIAKDQATAYHASSQQVLVGHATGASVLRSSWSPYVVRFARAERVGLSTEYKLILERTGGGSSATHLISDLPVDESIYTRDPVGSQVRVEIWYDDPISVRDRQETYSTQFHPDVIANYYHSILVSVTACGCIAIVIALIALAISSHRMMGARAREEEEQIHYVDQEVAETKPFFATFSKLQLTLGAVFAGGVIVVGAIALHIHDSPPPAAKPPMPAPLAQTSSDPANSAVPAVAPESTNTGGDAPMTGPPISYSRSADLPVLPKTRGPEPKLEKMPGVNPHGFILLRTPLEWHGWTVYWHDGIGAECWIRGQKHAYLWIKPKLNYITLNGKKMALI